MNSILVEVESINQEGVIMPEITQDILSQIVMNLKQKTGSVSIAALMKQIPGLTRQKARTLAKNNFILKAHGNFGRKKNETKLSPYIPQINEFLKIGITNSMVILDSIRDAGYTGGLTILKDYIKENGHLVPAKRALAPPKANRGLRYTTEPGDMYQMDWGFITVIDGAGTEWKCACFAMVCHHCGLRYIEFFPSARQENLFIGMLHGFMKMGVPKRVLTDNMKSVVEGRTSDNEIIWNKEYKVFMDTFGFSTTLCKVRHPFTKGSVERLVRYVKENFIVGKTFYNINELNREAIKWCEKKNDLPIKTRGDVIPNTEHPTEPLKMLDYDFIRENAIYLAPQRKIGSSENLMVKRYREINNK